jgi:hypothetical protein
MRTTTLAAHAALFGIAMSTFTWAQQPDRAGAQSVAPEARWTPSSAAPAGALSHALEGQRHDLFIELAQQGDIDIVFFGTTEAEMWWWPDRGRSVWDREFVALKAANFGSQGTQPASLKWRMQNGELDGYQAKMIVLQAGAVTDFGMSAEQLVVGYASLIEEIRLRQPQAKVLLFAPLPRGGSRQTWRQRADANESLFAPLVDNDTVFYEDIGARFFDPDGSFNRETWGLDAANRGTQTAAFEIWADAMQPWFDRLVR